MNLFPQIALIDDDRTWVETLADYFQSRGFTIQSAGDGASGLALLESDGIPVAVVDLEMPGMDGLELLRQLRRRRLGVKVLLVSGADEPGLARRSVAAGAYAFLSKTAPPALLLEAVRQALNQGGRRPRPWDFLLPAPRSA
jgi:DNA-binding NarL/FixJ family response regulator